MKVKTYARIIKYPTYITIRYTTEVDNAVSGSFETGSFMTESEARNFVLPNVTMV